MLACIGFLLTVHHQMEPDLFSAPENLGTNGTLPFLGGTSHLNVLLQSYLVAKAFSASITKVVFNICMYGLDVAVQEFRVVEDLATNFAHVLLVVKLDDVLS